MHNRDPFVVENGGAAFVPDGYFPFALEDAGVRDGYQVLEFGTPYARITAALREASLATGCRIRAFHALSDEEIAASCGLSIAGARLARIREYDEPFTIVDEEAAPALLEALEQRGLQWTRGGRFYHALGGHGKGPAVAALLKAYRRRHRDLCALGLGDSPNDLDFLRLMDRAIIVRAPHPQTELVFQSGGVLTPEQGPRGWNNAVIDFVTGR
jgi:mannosyl-3-phosphoglycerate phosphatase